MFGIKLTPNHVQTCTLMATLINCTKLYVILGKFLIQTTYINMDSTVSEDDLGPHFT